MPRPSGTCACRQFRPDEPEVLLLGGRVTRRSGAWNESEVLLDRYSELHGDDDALVLERLLLRAMRGELESAGPLLQLHIDQNDAAAPLAYEALAAGLLYRLRLVAANRNIEHWLEREPESTHAFLRGKLNEERERNRDALQDYRRVLELDPDHDEARLRMTTILLQLSQGEEALPHLEFLRRRLPDNSEVLVQRGQALDLQGRPDEARAAFDEALRRFPHSPSALTERGRVANRDGDSAYAEECLAQAVQLDPSNVQAHYQYHLALSRNGKTEAARREQDALGRIEADVKRIKELLQGRLQQTPNDPEPYYEVAMIALRAGRPKEALRWLLNALQVGPNHVPTHRALAAYYQEVGNPILSARHRALAQRLSGDPPSK